MNRALTWSLAALAAVAMAAACNLDGPEDHQADWTDSQALKELQASEANSKRREAAAVAVCREFKGPHGEARWTAEGHLVCRLPTGVKEAKL